MAITHVKVTYSVRPRTAARVAELATKWGVPKSEVIRRAVEEASTPPQPEARSKALAALRSFRENPAITMDEARRRIREVRRMRRQW